jgi:hypothetical protein
VTENARQYIITGATVLGAVATLAVLIKTSRPAATGVTAPGAAAPSSLPTLEIPKYPAASFAPSSFTIIEAPTFNAPGPRPSYFPTDANVGKSDSDCDCKNSACDHIVVVPLTTEAISDATNKLQRFYSMRA